MKKGKFNKWIILVALLLVLVIVWVLVIKSGFSKKQDNGDIIVKDNVHTITRSDCLSIYLIMEIGLFHI